MIRRRDSLSISGPNSRPMATDGRKSATSSALTHVAEPVRSYTSIGQRDDGDPGPEARRERRSEERPEARVAAQQAGLAMCRGARHVLPGPYRCAAAADDGRKSPVENGVVLGRPHGDAHRLGRAEARQRAGRSRPRAAGSPTAQTRLSPMIRVEEVRHRWRRPARSRGSRESPRAPHAPRSSPAACARSRRALSEAGQRRLLARRRHVEGAPHLAERAHERLRPHAVADAQPRQAVDLRERAHDEHVAARLEVRLDRVRVRRGRPRTRSTPDRSRSARGRARKRSTRRARRGRSPCPSGCSGSRCRRSSCAGPIAASIASRS